MHVIARGRIVDASNLDPHRPEEAAVAAELKNEGLLEHAYRCVDSPEVYVVLNAADLDRAKQAMGRLPFVRLGYLEFTYEEVSEI